MPVCGAAAATFGVFSSSSVAAAVAITYSFFMTISPLQFLPWRYRLRVCRGRIRRPSPGIFPPEAPGLPVAAPAVGQESVAEHDAWLALRGTLHIEPP